MPTLFILVWVVRLLTNPYGAGWHDKSARSIVVTAGEPPMSKLK